MPNTIAEYGQALTRAERDILQLAAWGHGRREIAALRLVSPQAIDQQMRDLREKLGANSKGHAIAIGIRTHLII